MKGAPLPTTLPETRKKRGRDETPGTSPTLGNVPLYTLPVTFILVNQQCPLPSFRLNVIILSEVSN